MADPNEYAICDSRDCSLLDTASEGTWHQKATERATALGRPVTVYHRTVLEFTVNPEGKIERHPTKYFPGDLPIGTRLVSLADPSIIGEVTNISETRGCEEVHIQWSNGNVSIAFTHLCTNEKAS